MTPSYILRLIGKILTYLLYLSTVLSAYGGFIPPRLWALPSVLALAFPYLLILSLLVAVAWLVGRRIFTAIAGGLTMVACWPVATAACPVAFSSEPENPCFSLMTYNVYDLQDYQHPEATGYSRSLGEVIRSKADIVCLQELYNLPRLNAELSSQSDSLRRLYPYIIKGKPFEGSYTPFMLLSKFPAREVPIPERYWADCALYRVQLPGQVIHVLNVHLTSYQLTQSERQVVSNIRSLRSARESLKMDRPLYDKLSVAFRDREECSRAIRELIDSIPGPLVICGDFNDVPGSYAYRTIRGNDISDAVAKTTFGPMITYHAHGFLFHIDQVLYRGDLRPNSALRGSIRSSDHYPLTVIFSY